MSMPPRGLVEQVEAAPLLPAGSDERFAGYGVLGLPFMSGHVLAMRRFPASSVGPPYTSVWHRTPAGKWVFYANVAPQQACTRFFGAIASEAIETPIAITWVAASRFMVNIPSASLEWEVSVGSTMATRLMNVVAGLLPGVAWGSSAFLTVMEMVAGPLLGVGRVGLHGRAPNGQRFIAIPRVLWAITDSRAVLAGEDLGPPGPLKPQARLADFFIPQRGMLVMGQTYFERFDSARHSSRTSGSQREAP